MTVSTLLTAEPIAADAELAGFIASARGAGAVVSFTGIARPQDHHGGHVQQLLLEHYPGMTERSLDTVAAATVERFEISSLHIVHRYGAIDPGETIVFVAAAATHRREAFRAADHAMDLLKTEAMFWKREAGVDGARWIEPSERDRADRERWDQQWPE